MPFLTVPSVTDMGSTSPAVTTTGSLGLGRDDFLRLFVTKLANQDPLSPMDDADFIAQMAQFTQLEQTVNMNELLTAALEQNKIMTQSITNTMATELIGRSVRVETGDLVLEDSGDTAIRFDLPRAAADVTVEISNAEGSLVRVLRLESRPSGTTEVTWDGQNVAGDRLPAGQYHIQIKATDADGEAIDARPYFRGTVDGVRYANGVAFLTIGDALVPISNVIEVSAGDNEDE